MDRRLSESVNTPFNIPSATFRSPYHTSATPFKLDEGYSEDTKSQTENETDQMTEAMLAVPEDIMDLSEEERAEFAYSLLRTLRTSTISAVVERLTPLLHLDPVAFLPPEITSEIFSYLEPSTLLTASMASRAWRDRILDSRLWKQMYAREGWGLDLVAVRDFERIQSDLLKSERKSRTRRAETEVGYHKNKKRFTAPGVDGLGSMRQSSKDSGQTKGLFGGGDLASLPTANAREDEEMRDVFEEGGSSIPQNCPLSRRRPLFSLRQDWNTSDHDPQISPSASHHSSITPGSPRSATKPIYSALLHHFSNTAKLNWQHLYKQRRRLEDNWNTGNFTNFQLPHPQYPHEAHTECVYTIQFIGKWLVSGSRDKTLRIWDLETRRLRGQPLMGHLQSVLCLQFDPSQQEDVIISGSSDCNVIVWQFSTGKKIHEIEKAHGESVLNLRFDSRYLVTCSKDKLIKVWSRNELKATDKDYPKRTPDSTARYPHYIINNTEIPAFTLEAHIASGHIKTIKPYELLMTLSGHQAAVNAIQIGSDEIVSASGDRNIRIWTIQDGNCIRTCFGHQKGIACVQFDSHRIVSGSSDNTVRIFDHATGAEVACLNGHTNLVRTVQAGFGDLPGDNEALAQEAKAVDQEFYAARRAGLIPVATTRAQRRANLLGNPGSRNPKDLTAVGAKIPPNGGGSRWGRIVSGSYDETIIIWKRAPDGRWIVNQKLRQDEAARAAAGGYAGNQIAPRIIQAGPTLTAPQLVQQAIQTSMASLQNGVQNVMNIGAALNYQPVAIQNQTHHQHQPQGASGLPQPQHPQNYQSHVQHHSHAPHLSSTSQGQHGNVHNNLASAAALLQDHPQAGPTPAQLNTTEPVVAPGPQQNAMPTNPTVSAQTSNHQQQQQPPPPPPPQNQHQTAHPHAILHNPTNNPVLVPLPTQTPASRVFKLQFDARRIICCSQDPKIVGWDFAAGDPAIEQCADFFAGP